MDKILNENCLDSLKKNLDYDYVFTCPPDFAELNLDPISDFIKYKDFLNSVFCLLKPKNNVMTISITDRKYKSQVISKHSIIIDLMKELGFPLHSHKIWVKTEKVDFIRLGYAHVMSFGSSISVNNNFSDYKPDVWKDGYGPIIDGFRNAMPTDVITRCILKFTNENQTVYDPFMGSGSTAISCINTKRKYLGSEIDNKIFKICEKRIKDLTPPLFSL